MYTMGTGNRLKVFYNEKQNVADNDNFSPSADIMNFDMHYGNGTDDIKIN